MYAPYSLLRGKQLNRCVHHAVHALCLFPVGFAPPTGVMERAQGCENVNGLPCDGFGAEYHIPQTPARREQTKETKHNKLKTSHILRQIML